MKAKGALTLACGVLLYLFKAQELTLGTFNPFVEAGLLIGSVVFGVLLIVDVAAWGAAPFIERQHLSRLASRRAVRRQEQEQDLDRARAAVIARLDHLSREEIRYVASALEKNTPTFYTYAYSPPVGALQAKGLVWSTNGTHHQDHYPFSFHDFVWVELMKRREEFLDKEQAYIRAEEQKKRHNRR